MAVNVKEVKSGTVAPPPLVKGRRGSQIPPELLKSMAETIKAGEYATIVKDDGSPVDFDTRDQAQSALTRFRKALAEHLPKSVELSGRIWGDKRTTANDGGETYAPPFHFAVGDKAKVAQD